MLDVLLGEWSMEAVFPGAPPSDARGRVSFEWMAGERFLIQRWDTPVPEAPDGLAVIGYDEGRETLLQHYFDSRGVARVYEMTLGDGVWTLTRTKPDFSPLSFAQRFVGRFSDDGMRIDGRWEIAHDGTTFEHDFELIYTRTR
jgi:hypothetical protein